MAKNTITSTDINTEKADSHKEALDQVRPGLTENVPDPAAASDPINQHAWEIANQADYKNKYSGELAMAALSDFATPAAAVTAGYAKIQQDRGATFKAGLQYLTIFEKWLSGEPGANGFNFRVTGESAASAAAADTAALATLNAQRGVRYGRGASQNPGALPANAANPHTVDTT